MSSYRWQDDAACIGIDPDLFYPGKGDDQSEAVATCHGCPVREECLEYSLTPPIETFGIWGGLNERQRRRERIRRSRGSAAAEEWTARKRASEKIASAAYKATEEARKVRRAREAQTRALARARAGAPVAPDRGEVAGVMDVLYILEREGRG